MENFAVTEKSLPALKVIADQLKFLHINQKVQKAQTVHSFKGLGFQLNFTYCLLNLIPMGFPIEYQIRKVFI